MDTAVRMSRDHNGEDDAGHDGHGRLQSFSMYDNDDTPRSEAVPPSAIHLRTPGGTAATFVQPHTTNDYFALPVDFQHTTIAERGASSVTSLGHNSIEIQQHNALSTSDIRPAVQTLPSNLSIESNDSAITVTPTNPSVRSAILAQQPPPSLAQQFPVYPNQSYAALQHQKHPSPHVTSLYRQRTANSPNVLTFTSALASVHPSGSRTAASSPALPQSNGLFNPHLIREQRDYESAENLGTYASPFLHFTHRQVPKETHVADVDVNTSGKKIINHYEIVDELGRGTHGKVKLGRDLSQDGTFVAIKIVERYSKRRKLGKLGQAEDKVKKEVAILKKARHPNIVALLEVIDDPTRKKVYIVLEWVERGEIQWRSKAYFKEIALLEARRYERERNAGPASAFSEQDEEQALLAEVERRLVRRQNRELRRFRRGLRMASNNVAAFSHEMVGDYDSGEDDDDLLSRISTATADSLPSRPIAAESRLPSRPETPLISLAPSGTSTPQTPCLDSMSPDPERSAPVLAPKPQIPLSDLRQERRSNSCKEVPAETHYHNGIDTGSWSTTDVSRRVHDILGSDLNPELEYVPIMTLQQVRVAFRDTLLGLQYLHGQGIVHRDIKPPNLLSTYDRRVKISDFGVSYLGRPVNEGDAPEDVSEHEAQELDEAKELAKTVGTPAFYAPELCITESTEDPLPVTKAIDVWALGVTLFCMIFARTPFVENEYVVMRQIADEEVYIPSKRLLPVLLKPHSRPTSHQRGDQQTFSGRRAHDIVLYEDVDHDLHDLLRQLLTKDPRKRITLEEVRHHPWVLADLSDKDNWLSETDPTKTVQSKKIEVSREDLNAAVVPLQFLDRVRSGIKKVGERLGLRGKSVSRSRASSGADLTSTDSASISAFSSSSNFGHDARRQSVFDDEVILSALQRSREQEQRFHHCEPGGLPDVQSKSGYYDAISVASSVDDEHAERGQRKMSQSTAQQAQTTTSTGDSVRTLTNSEHLAPEGSDVATSSSGPSATSTALGSPGGNAISMILGNGSARRVFNTLRERNSRQGALHSSNSQASQDSSQPHGNPSIAMSNAVASGHLNLPDALQETHNVGVSSHDDSSSSPSAPSPLILDDVHSAALTPRQLSEHDSRSDLGHVQPSQHGRMTSRSDGLPSVAGEPESCPSRNDSSAGHFPVSSSSEFGSALSMSASNRSHRSAMSENSSLEPIDVMLKANERYSQQQNFDAGARETHVDSFDSGDDGYRPDFSSILNSDEEEEEDSSDSDDGLVMTRQRPRLSQNIVPAGSPGVGGGLVRRNTGQSYRTVKASRSASNHTMKGV